MREAGQKSKGKFKLSLAFIQPEFPNRKTKAPHLWVNSPMTEQGLSFKEELRQAQSGHLESDSTKSS